MLKLNMLLYITTIYGLVCMTSGQENRIMISITPDQALELRKCAESCGQEYGVDPNALREILTWTLPNDERHKQFLQCIFFTSGYQQGDGHFKVDKMSTLTPVNGTREELKRIFEDCNKTTLKNNLETVYEMGNCFHKHLIPKLETAM